MESSDLTRAESGKRQFDSMTPSRHNRHWRHNMITPEYPIKKLRMSATVFDISHDSYPEQATCGTNPSDQA